MPHRHDAQQLPSAGHGTPTLCIDGVVHPGTYDAATLLETLTR
jgi:hypothetical protein